jgi:hypothetical protein
MASWRKTKKAFDCARHYIGPRFMVTGDPYPIYNNEDYCTIGKFDFTWGPPSKELPCSTCKCFKGSRAMNRKARELERECKKNQKFWNHCEKAGRQHGLTGEEYFERFYKQNDEILDILF